jgi:hypothetical protein
VRVHRLALVVVLLAPALAAADPAPGTVYASVAACLCTAGVRGTPTYGEFGYDLALGVRVHDVWIRAAFARSQFVDGTTGTFVEPRLGIEHRTYDNPHASAFFGLDTGFVTGSGYWEDAYDKSTLTGGFVMSRGRIEGGSEHVRVRVVLEFLLGYGHAVDRPGDTPAGTTDRTGLMRGVNLNLGFTVR